MGLIECHSHLLPFVDDGVRSKEESFKILQAYAKAGFDRIVVTPHLYNPMVSTRIHNIRPMYAWAGEEAKKLGIELILGSETYVGGAVDPQVLPFINNYVLIEVDTSTEPLFLLNHAYSLRKRGLFVILAHVERYRWFKEDGQLTDKLREIGVFFQSNVEGVENGEAEKFLKLGMIDIIAGDNHGNEQLPARLATALRDNPTVLQRMENLFRSR
ncbi:CpsB/CapC family capsule biosynthesis tyrosine phosphatase [Pleomorphochaeta sp. DL1XJH-081]|jgi:protein-tyrosine phosphatase|uniref:CpsB/CapC family capsule biosynthesis tyrosine phosphatase n=1 Tax=Pleomorphochaeta sp. DL1XJH-081 TaxID=3409690 RepID=UPI003BB710BB